MAKLFSKYRVILSGRVLPEYDRQEVLEGLARIFNSRTDAMEKLLQGKAVPLKKEYDKDQATLISEKVRKIGAECSIEEIPEVPLELLKEDALPRTSVADDSRDAKVRAGADDSTRYGSQVYPNREDSVQTPGHGPDTLTNLVMNFVNSNLDYYRHQFQRFGSVRNPTYRLSWNWPAFFFFFFWALYRKMWLWAIVYVLGGTALMMFLPPGPVSLVWLFAWPLSANYIYFRRAILNAKAAMQQPELEAACLNKGGVSKRAVWAGLMLAVVISITTSNYITARIMEEFGEHIQETLPGSGTQIRGDGTAVVEISGTKTSLSRTSLTLSYLGTSLKIMLVSSKTRENPDTVGRFIEKINTDKVKDGWGQEIRIVAEPMRYLLVSAGPDGAFDSEDDVIQPVNFE
jgi:hypothetical protein